MKNCVYRINSFLRFKEFEILQCWHVQSLNWHVAGSSMNHWHIVLWIACVWLFACWQQILWSDDLFKQFGPRFMNHRHFVFWIACVWLFPCWQQILWSDDLFKQFGPRFMNHQHIVLWIACVWLFVCWKQILWSAYDLFRTVWTWSGTKLFWHPERIFERIFFLKSPQMERKSGKFT